MKRRDFIRSGVLAGLAGTLPVGGRVPPLAAAGGRPLADPPVGRARNVIFFVYDGFGHEDLATARFFAERHVGGRVLITERLHARGASGLMLPHSFDSIVTDSAAASTAWSTGRKVDNYAISVDPEGRELTTVLELAKGAGRATGLITTTRLTHATPAAWIAKTPSRALEDEIALQYLAFQPDVLLGGGSLHFDAAVRPDGRDLFGEFGALGYGVLRTPEDLARTNASRVIGAFTPDHLSYEIDRLHQGGPGPSLADITRKGLEILAGSPRGFVAQIEAGRVDHANHQNDTGAMVWDVLAGDEALAVAIDFVHRHPDTLLIVTSDHATGGGAVYGTGPNYSGSNDVFAGLALRRGSQEVMLAELGRQPAPAHVADAVHRFFGFPIAAAEAERIAEAIALRPVVGHPVGHGRDVSASMHQLLTGRDENGRERLNHNYGSIRHTATAVPLTVYGVGTGTAGLGVVDNTDLFRWMLHAIDVEYENPGPAWTGVAPLGA